MSDFLAALRDRVLIFDGAFGTWVQDQDLGPDDFGGPELEGCNEHVVLTRPDVIAEMHREFFDVGVDAVELAIATERRAGSSLSRSLSGGSAGSAPRRISALSRTTSSLKANGLTR